MQHRLVETMQRARFQRPASPLPGDFSSGVLERIGREPAASGPDSPRLVVVMAAVAVLAAAGISLVNRPPAATASPPPLGLFGGPGRPAALTPP